MSIDYRVRVEIPEGVIELFGNDAEFLILKEDALEGSTMDDISNGAIIVEFDDITQAQQCEVKLDYMIDEFTNRRLALISQLHLIQSSIGELVSNTTPTMMQELLRQSTDDVSESLKHFIVEEAIAWQELNND